MQALVAYLPNFLLILCRITAFFVVAPVFATRSIPAQWKIGLASLIAFTVFAASGRSTIMPMDGQYVLLVLRETLVGLLLGFVAQLFFTVVQIAGAVIDIQMGLGIANVIDPMTGAQSPIMGNFKFIVAMLLFLTFNGHHYLIDGIMRSYEWIPLDRESFARIVQGGVSDFLVSSLDDVFALSLQMAAPVVVSLFLTDVGLGILAKTAPQFNIFVVGLPVKIIVGFLALAIALPGMLVWFQDWFRSLFEAMDKLARLIGAQP